MTARRGGSATPDGRPMAEQPRWRRDFPVEWAEDEYISRREMVKFMALTSFAFVGGHLWLLVQEMRQRGAARPAPEPVAIARVAELAVGEARVFEFPHGSTPRLLVRTGEAQFVAYDQQCTHLLCPVVPQPVDGKLHCPCHNGWFDLATGRPLAGPPRRPLARVTLEIRGDTVWAIGVEDRS